MDKIGHCVQNWTMWTKLDTIGQKFLPSISISGKAKLGPSFVNPPTFSLLFLTTLFWLLTTGILLADDVVEVEVVEIVVVGLACLNLGGA